MARERAVMVAYKALKAVSNTEMTLFAQDLDLRYLWLFNAQGSWLADAKNGDCDQDFLPVPSADKAKAIKEETLKTGTPVRFELPVASGDSTRWFDVRVDVDRNDAGAIVGLIGTSVEITDQKRREDTLKTLLREVSHRSKNLLAIIQSLASQTARHSVTVPEFLVRFRGRIQSLASSQDIVTDTDWRGADLFSLVTLQVERYAPDGMEQIRFEGVDVYLTPTAALHVGLALHELAVNAASYGALSVPGGRVEIVSRLETREGQTSLLLRWRESNGPRVRVDYDPRFGTSTLERIVPNSVGGEAALDYRPDGIQYWLRVPRNQFELVDG